MTANHFQRRNIIWDRIDDSVDDALWESNREGMTYPVRDLIWDSTVVPVLNSARRSLNNSISIVTANRIQEL